jgi:ribosomal protein S18 acetylase RimI-like enzyme
LHRVRLSHWFNIKQAMQIETVINQDRQALIAIAVSTGLFTSEEAEGLLGGVLDGLASGSLPEGHQAVACRLRAGGSFVGWTYFAPDQHAQGVWNLWWIGVDPEHHGVGAGVQLLRHAESVVASKGGRVLIIETSDALALARARRFYEAQGYRECGRIPDFYAEGESKVVFARCPRAR